jgi:DNA-binding NarL/FixJ family response regulator
MVSSPQTANPSPKQTMTINAQSASIVALLIVTILVITDVVMDALAGGAPAHLAMEAFAAFIALSALAVLLRDWRNSRTRVAQLDEEAAVWKQRSKKWIDGLAQEIDQQMTRWGFTPSEKDVAFLLIKGLSTKDIAAVRGRSEQTVRTQAASIYTKAGVSGRTQLAAWFLEDLV